MLKNVAILVYPGVAPFELGVLCEAWGVDRSQHGMQNFDLGICAPEPGRVSTSLPGFSLEVTEGLERVADADLVCLPAMPRNDPVPPEVIDALRAAHDNGARLMSVCAGAFVLGEAGLLDGRKCTTHWLYTDELAERFPKALVQRDVLYVDSGSIITSAGSAAGLDACLHLIRDEFGAGAAATVARRMVIAAHRDGGQAQFIESPVPECTADTLQPLLEWMTAHINEDMSVDSLAARATMSPRTFARRFKAETGTTPYHWVTNQRVMLAERLLENTDDTIERIAGQVGFSNATAFRHHFARLRGTTPLQYRRLFRVPTAI